LMGLGLMGGGLAALYFSVYAAVGMYSLIPVSLGFIMAVLVTVTAGFLAVRTDSMLVAILGIIGGYCSPLLLRTADPNLAVFYSYMLLLGLGIMGITRYKPWRLLNYLSFLFTYSLFFVSLTHYQRADFPLALTFLSLFFVVQSSLVYMHNITQGNKSTILEVIHLLLNAGFYAATSYSLIINACGRPYPAIMSVALAGFYILHVMVFLKKKIVDRNLLIALIALAGFCITWTMPLIMEKETLTLSWSLQAIAFLWLGYKLNSNFIRHTAYIIYGIVFCRLLFMDIPANFGMSPVREVQMSVYWRAMIERLWNFGVSIGSVIGGFFLQNRQAKTARQPVKKQNDIPQLIGKNLTGNILYWFCALFVFLFVHLELNTMFAYFQPLRLPVLTILWCAMAVYFLYGFLKTGSSSKIMFAAMSIFLLAAVVKIFIIDLSSWKICAKLFYNMEYSWFYASLRLLDFGGVLVIVFMVWWFFSRTDAVRRAAVAFGSLGWLLLFIYTSLEVNTFLYWRLPGFQAGGISILWALFAAGFVVGGIWKNIPRLRYSGLCLFAVVAGKVFLSDLQNLAIIYRVIAFLVVGVFLLLGAFSYMYAGSKFIKKRG
ncbi:MAG: DUF2339 domain-containing protein, partial [Candidatus Omnitrophica bacterium]|nr:DUF2339 domain-containing protein [Candidatus Omnitrophota bacterium]